MRLGRRTEFAKREIDLSDENNMLIGAIVSTSFLCRIAPIYNPELLEITAGKIVMEWVLDWFAKYGEAPGANIQRVFEEQAAFLDRASADWIAAFLGARSKDFDAAPAVVVGNEEYLFDRTVKYFERQFLYKAGKKVVDLIRRGDVAGARSVWLKDMLRVDSGRIRGGVFDKETLELVYNNPTPRAKLDLSVGMSALHELTGELLSDWLVLFMGPMGRGKTTILTDIAVTAMLQGLNVMFYSLESSVEDVFKRIYRNMFVLVSGNRGGGKEIEFRGFDGDSGDVRLEAVEVRPSVERRDVVEAGIRRWKKTRVVRGRGRAVVERELPRGEMMVQSFPSFSAGYAEIAADLDTRRVLYNFTPHVIVVDYAGIMAAPKGYFGRDVYDYNTKMLKRLAEERRAVVLSGIQGKRNTLSDDNIKSTDVPEDIRQLAHVDVMIAINQNESEQELSRIRFSVLKHRWRRFTPRRQAAVLQQLDTAQAYIDGRVIMVKSGSKKVSEILEDDID